MITVNVSSNVRELSRAFDFLSRSQVAKASSQAINQTLLLGRTEARRAVKKVYNIPQRYMSGINLKKATANTLTGNVYATSKPIPMDAFSPKFDFRGSSGNASILSVTRRGILKVQAVKRTKNRAGVSIEVVKGERKAVPYAFLIPGAKPRVFARGEYKGGNGRYGFIQRHTRQDNDQGNDSVKPLISITVFGAVINPSVKNNISRVIQNKFPENMLKALRRQAGII